LNSPLTPNPVLGTLLPSIYVFIENFQRVPFLVFWQGQSNRRFIQSLLRHSSSKWMLRWLANFRSPTLWQRWPVTTHVQCRFAALLWL
jgi:hypothetical protein